MQSMYMDLGCRLFITNITQIGIDLETRNCKKNLWQLSYEEG